MPLTVAHGAGHAGAADRLRQRGQPPARARRHARARNRVAPRHRRRRAAESCVNCSSRARCWPPPVPRWVCGSPAFGSDADRGPDRRHARRARMGPTRHSRRSTVAPNARVLGVTVSIAAATTLIFGIVPAWRASATVARRRGAMAAAWPNRTAGRPPSLIVAQVSLSLILVIRRRAVRAHPSQPARARPRLYPRQRAARQLRSARAGLSSPELQAFNQSVLRTVEALPGVGAASIAAITPLAGRRHEHADDGQRCLDRDGGGLLQHHRSAVLRDRRDAARRRAATSPTLMMAMRRRWRW